MWAHRFTAAGYDKTTTSPATKQKPGGQTAQLLEAPLRPRQQNLHAESQSLISGVSLTGAEQHLRIGGALGRAGGGHRTIRAGGRLP